jgi:hypothetical protein
MDQFIEQEMARFNEKYGYDSPAQPAQQSEVVPEVKHKSGQDVKVTGPKPAVTELPLGPKSSSESSDSSDFSDSSDSSEEAEVREPPVHDDNFDQRVAAYARVKARMEAAQKREPAPQPKVVGRRGFFNIWS